ncbi:hypothetical protein [Membranihabitans marinus]|uniref:hypothetical protein n=1 Tax=Membranihabitans marinus TaxID=1227546 RepID=UPI001F470E6A|nr:hypothetical protein [Membranihabitans marinus]
MKNLTNFILVVIIIILGRHSVSAQLQGISYTLSPYAEYHWPVKNSGLDNGIMGGIQLGIGFGEYVELGANYAEGFGLSTKLDQFNFDPTDAQISNYQSRDVSFKRMGGELKLNLSRGALLPYFSIGAGVQSIGADSLATSDQLYVVPGVGIKFSAGDRYTIGFQALNYNYNYNSNISLLSPLERESYGLADQNFDQEKISNWALRASLAFYLGGRKPGQLTDIDRAYLDQFSSGFQGLSLPIEFHVSKMDFHNDLPYTDTWMAGVSTGLNFGPLIGIRGFYSRAIDDEGSNLDFDDLSMYGGEVKFKLNEGKGIIPWITLGGGNIQVGDEYTGLADSLTFDKNKGFVQAGLGLEIPFSKYVKLTGYAKSILTTQQDIENISLPDEIKSSWNYGMSLNFVMGKKKEKIEVVKQTAFDDYLITSSIEQEIAKEKLIAEYEEKLDILESQLAEAVAAKDLEAVKEISEQKSNTEKVIEELDKKSSVEVEKEIIVKEEEKVSQTTPAATQPVPAMPTAPVTQEMPQEKVRSSIQMTPEELRLLIKEIIQGMKEQQSSTSDVNSSSRSMSDPQREARRNEIENMQRKMREIEAMVEYPAREKKLTEISEDKSSLDPVDADIYMQLARLESKINQLLNQQNLPPMPNNVNPSGNQANPPVIVQQPVPVEYNEEQLQEIIDVTNRRMDDMEYMLERYLKQLEKSTKSKQEKVASEKQEKMVPAMEEEMMDQDSSSRWSLNDKVRYNGMSGFAGFGLGENATFNLGYRVHYMIGKEGSPFEFMPESFFGLGSPSSFGINANGLYHIRIPSIPPHIRPYAGLGVGLLKAAKGSSEDKLLGAWNFIIGTTLDVNFGEIYVDFTGRNAFKYNQLIVGYVFPF